MPRKQIPPDAIVERRPGCHPMFGKNAVAHDWQWMGTSSSGTKFYICKRRGCAAQKQVSAQPQPGEE